MKRPILYFSFRSPFSWMAVERLRSALPDLHRTVEFVPYWDPDPITEAALHDSGGEFHYVQMSKAKHLYILQDTKRQAARLGLTMRWPVDRDPWWEVPHLGFLAAQRLGGEAAFYREITAARWERGEDICMPGVVADAAVRAGLPPDVLAAAPADNELRSAGVECLLRAYYDDVFGIPYLRIGRQRFWGLDRVDDALAALAAEEPPAARRRRPAPETVAVSGGGYDTDTAGGCG